MWLCRQQHPAGAPFACAEPVTAAFSSGPLVGRLGVRRFLVLGAGSFLAGALTLSLVPPFLGLLGAWLALVFVIFGFIGTEVVAVTAGEAKNPDQALPKAMRSMVARLIVFYIAAITVLLAVIPWNEIQPGQDITASPFVKVFAWTGIPAAAHIINFVVLTAALSSINCNIYLATRMMFSLARGGMHAVLVVH